MAKRLCDLKVAELRAELEDRELELSGKKSELVERLRVALENDGYDPETVLFNDEASTLISSISANMDEKISGMEEKISTNVKNDISAIKNDFSAMDEKISTMKNYISANMDKLSADFLLMKNDIAADVENKISSLK